MNNAKKMFPFFSRKNTEREHFNQSFYYELYKEEWFLKIGLERKVASYKKWYENELLPKMTVYYHPLADLYKERYPENYERMWGGSAYPGMSHDVSKAIPYSHWLLHIEGIDGEIYHTQEEFLMNEYRDKEYLKYLDANSRRIFNEYAKLENEFRTIVGKYESTSELFTQRFNELCAEYVEKGGMAA